MNNISDRALQVLQRIAKVWQVDAESIVWSQETEHCALGFEWWPGDCCVRVYAHHAEEQSSETELKVVIRTDCLKDVAVDSNCFEQMAAVMSRSCTSTYAWVYPPRPFWQKFEPSKSGPGLWFCSSGYISSDNIEWMPELLANTGIIQPINAQIQSRNLTDMLGSGVPDTSRPEALRDRDLDGILEAIAEVFAPLGETPSRWVATGEFEAFVEKWARSDSSFGFGDTSGMTLETPFGNDSVLIKFLTEEKHPQLGHGLLATLQLPYAADALTIAREAAELNFLEFLTWTNFPQLGCWHSNQNRADQEGLAFSLFMPNALYQPGLTAQIAFWFMQRARWVREQKVSEMKDATMLEVLTERHSRAVGLRRSAADKP
jgi:hypothetical protein